MASKRPDAAKILIVDDHPIVREGLAMHLAEQPDLEVCGEAEDVAGALAFLASARPDLTIVDVALPSGNGLDLVRRIADRYESVRVLVWSMYPEHLYAERALRAGAMGYISKGQATHDVLEAIRAILRGKVHVSGGLTDQFLRRMVGRSTAERSPVDSLSDRELETFRLIGEGLTTDAIAERMHVSPKTVDTFRARVKEKLGLKNMTQLIQRACQWVAEAKP
jgi:DNA-binding NarL/FixJ family response regulator